MIYVCTYIRMNRHLHRVPTTTAPRKAPPPPLGAPPKPSVFSAREVTLASSLPPLSRSPDPDGPYIEYETPPNVNTGLPVVLWFPKFWRMDGRRQTGSSLTRVLKRMELLGGSHGIYGTVFGEGACLPALADQTNTQPFFGRSTAVRVVVKRRNGIHSPLLRGCSAAV